MRGFQEEQIAQERRNDAKHVLGNEGGFIRLEYRLSLGVFREIMLGRHFGGKFGRL